MFGVKSSLEKGRANGHRSINDRIAVTCEVGERARACH
jgi:hypothetical protein